MQTKNTASKIDNAEEYFKDSVCDKKTDNTHNLTQCFTVQIRIIQAYQEGKVFTNTTKKD